MTYLYILLTGIGIGSLLGFGLKTCCCSDDKVYTDEYNSDENANNSIDTDESDIDGDHNIVTDTRGYIQYLESMLNNSTDVATSSFSLQPIDISYNNITSDFIRTSPPKPSAPAEGLIYIQDEDILGYIDYTNVKEPDRV